SAPADQPTNAILPLLVTGGEASAAALLAKEESGYRYADAGGDVARSDHFRAGSITKTFVATVVLQLAEEDRLSLSDTVEEHLPGVVRGAGNDRSEEHTSEHQSRENLVCRLLLEKKKE